MKIAFVTGGNRGIGLASARRLARDGSQVVITARDAAAGEDAAERLRHEGLAVTSLRMDVTDQISVRSAAAAVDERFGRVDALVNNAGILPEATNAEPREIVDLEMFRRTFDTNLFGAVAVLEAFLPLVRRSPAGRIVNISTTMGSLADQTNPESPYFSLVVPAYQASKTALNGVTIALAKQLNGTPIKVTSVCPGFVRTDLAPAARDAPLAPEDAAEVVHRAASLPDSAASGTFIDAGGTVPW
jgi:NAD(P)-dependent dehydrogenase (short-subunit alcohol dehydrogenase family)